MKLKFLLTGLMIASALPVVASAQDGVNEPLAVIHPTMHVERDNPELCLEFNHNLDGILTAPRFAANARLEVDGKNTIVAQKNISLGSNQVCLSGLEHRKEYRLTLAALDNEKGQELSSSYFYKFKIPPRRTSLAFISQKNSDGIDLWQNDLTISSVNSNKITVELYRISDSAKMAEAWNQRRQTTLVPTESLYFAKQNGALIWTKDVAPEANSDRPVITKIDLGKEAHPDFPPGLYLVVANNIETPDTNASPEKEKKKNTSQPVVAASWLLRSDLRVYGLMDGKAVTALVESADKSGVVANAKLLLLDGDQKTIAEGRSDLKGVLTLSPPSGPTAKTLFATDESGNIALADVPDMPNSGVSPTVATLEKDQTSYQPFETVILSLGLQDIHKHPQNAKGSVVQILRPDYSVYDVHTVNLDASGHAKLTFTTPIPHGLWHVVWVQENGARLAEIGLPVNQSKDAPHFHLTVDRSVLTAGNEIMLEVRSLANSNALLPYVSGHVELAWKKNDHPFDAWKAYVFDDGSQPDRQHVTVASFVTDKNGVARVRFSLPDNDRPVAYRVAELQASSDPSEGITDSEPIELPVKPSAGSVGIHPSAGNGSFPENSLAHFDIVAVDGDGKARSVEGLRYQILEQGRNFEWFQTEGRWDYKPQQQKRHITGGNVYFADNGQAVIEWPVTSGSYQLEITNADGEVVANENFNAGWITSDQDNGGTVLDIKASPPNVQSGAPEKITFTLPHEAVVTTSISDDHLRSVIHDVYPAGSNTIAFTSAADWGDRLMVRAEAHFQDNAKAVGQVLVVPEHEAAPYSVRNAVTPGASKPVLLADVARGLKTISQQDIEPQANATFDVGKIHAANRPEVWIISPYHFEHLSESLSAFLHMHPVTTDDLADQIDHLRRWHETIVSLGLMQSAEIQSYDKNLLLRILARQKNDGGFPLLPDDGPSSMSSTSSVLQALAGDEDPVVRRAADQAAHWLQHYLENTWFNEGERASRASAYAALAKAGKLDLASLHYFSDTSAQKTLTPLAAAQMAYAFASIGDRPASNFWIDKVKEFSPDLDKIPVGVFAALLANKYFEPDSPPFSLESMLKIINQSNDQDSLTPRLIAIWQTLDRAGSWSYQIGKDEKSQRGIVVVPASEKVPLTIRNPSSDRVIGVEGAKLEKVEADKNKTHRHIYDLDGKENIGVLKRGAAYVVMIDGVWQHDQIALDLHDNPQPVLVPMTCLLDPPNNDGFLSWLASRALFAARACERSVSGVDALLMRGENGGEDQWHVAYMAKAVASSKAQNLRAAAVKEFLSANPGDKDGRH